jgi:hypothetical protein
MNASKFVAVSTLAILAAIGSVAAQADEADASQYAVQVTSQRTRAEVKAEAVAAVGDRSQDLAALGVTTVHSNVGRAEVRAQAAKALRLGQIPAGETSSM